MVTVFLAPVTQANEMLILAEKSEEGNGSTVERYWEEVEFEGLIAHTSEGSLTVVDPDITARWIVVFKQPALSEEIRRQGVGVGLQQARSRAKVLRQNIAQEQTRSLNTWRGKNWIQQVNARFDVLLNAVAVEAKGEDIEAIAQQPEVASVHPDYLVHINLSDSVPLVGAPEVWWNFQDDYGRPITGSTVRVAVIDTGIDYRHSAFGSCSALNTGGDCRVVGGYDFVNTNDDPMDDHNHGTHVAGIIAGDDDSIIGLAPDALLYAYKVCNASGSCWSSNIVAALERAADPNNDGDTSDRVDVANLSLGGPGGPDSPLSLAVNEAVKTGMSVVVSAGNSGPNYNTVGSPAAAAQAITVGASSKTDSLASLSSRGPVAGSIIKPDLVAPGVSINSSFKNYGYGVYSGTSMSAPHVAGAVALLKQLHPTWTPAQLKAAVANSARDLSLNPFAQGSGRLQVAEAASSTYLATPNSLSMGIVDNTLPFWTSTQSITVYNAAESIQNISLSIALSLPAGLTASLSQNILTLASGESQSVDLHVTADNSVLPYPSNEPYSYSGKVVLNNGTQVRQIPFALIKPNTNRKGMTWGVSLYDSSSDVSRLHCCGQPSIGSSCCDAYKGDTLCSVSLPVLCVNVDGSSRPPYDLYGGGSAMPQAYYNGWLEGTASLTSPVPGISFSNLNDVNAYCEAQFGAGYRVAEFHDGRWIDGMDASTFHGSTWPIITSFGGWGFYAPTQFPNTSRFWVHINNQNANCWNGFTVEKGSIGDQVWADPDNDGNGQLDGDDYPLSGIIMRLYDSLGNLIRTTTTSENGKYLFSHLDYGTYTVEVDQTTLPTDMQGNVAYDPDGGADGRSTTSISSSHQNNLSQDFAFFVESMWTLTVKSSGASNVAIAANPSLYGSTTNYSVPDVPENTSITLKAPVNTGGNKVFSSWQGCNATDSVARTCTLTVSEDREVRVHYVPKTTQRPGHRELLPRAER
jgi:subtilisin family serine protease